jgi:hypothetical protein
MGQEIKSWIFSEDERREYARKLHRETVLLRQMLKDGAFSQNHGKGGFELEGCLVGNDFRPKPVNKEFLDVLNSPLATTELAKFNMELNSEPLTLQGDALSTFENSMLETLGHCHEAAKKVAARLVFTGILPTAQHSDFRPENMSDLHRYHAMNSEILKVRHGHGLKINIEGHDAVHCKIDSVMLEAATTSFQLHFQIPAQNAHNFYNAALMVSGVIIAVCGNSPFLFGSSLWRETRIPVFEQAVDLGRNHSPRVSFGTSYIKDIFECFDENICSFSPLIPSIQDKEESKFAHLALHNGVIWRWNRPLIGFDEDGRPHIRIEHRILPAGPTPIDMIANAAFFYGLVQYFATRFDTEAPIGFLEARKNFYVAARFGLGATMGWKAKEQKASELVISLVENARIGLEELGLNAAGYLEIIEARAKTGQTGAIWQERQLDRANHDFSKMLEIYYNNQRQNIPVHNWKLE